ncbi:MAG: hypothetical protein ABW139_11215 [Candidatus Thiodiazotropha sp. DIVDIV]
MKKVEARVAGYRSARPCLLATEADNHWVMACGSPGCCLIGMSEAGSHAG